MNFYKNNQNTVILKLIEMSNICHDRFAANYPKFLSSDLIDLLAILQKSLERAIFLYNFIREARLSGVRASIAIVHIRKFYKFL